MRIVVVALVVAALHPAILAEAQSSQRPLVVIDAGHGGVDPGALGAGGIPEKEIVLSLAHELSRLLAIDARYDVRLTRHGDTLVPLAQRTAMANRWRREGGTDRPALFLSIHANAHAQRSVRGYETYFLSEALTEDARRVAERENASLRFEATTGLDPLPFILNDLRQNLYLRESSEAATIFQSRLREAHPGPDRGVKQAGFVVLEGAFMPAVLVEVGFISNPHDEALLASGDFQRRTAEQLSAAVDAFFARSAGEYLSIAR